MSILVYVYISKKKEEVLFNSLFFFKKNYYIFPKIIQNYRIPTILKCGLDLPGWAVDLSYFLEK